MISISLEQTKKVAQDFLQNLVPLTDQATVVELIGDLGAGKTTFTQAIAQHLSVSETVVSPTFVIQKRYTIPNHPHFKTLIHIDAYRLESPDEILRLNWKEDLENPENLVLVEWSEKIQSHLPESKQITFTFIDEHTREIDW
jgi:tRNA threonylcarbamoyladenosine biosynthesis protein TsaE